MGLFLARNFNSEDLKKGIGIVLRDLRGSWIMDNESRINMLEDIVNELQCRDGQSEKDLEEYNEIDSTIFTARFDISDGCYDGRIFRNCSSFYENEDESVGQEFGEILEEYLLNYTHGEE